MLQTSFNLWQQLSLFSLRELLMSLRSNLPSTCFLFFLYSSTSSALGNINDSKKRWMVFGLALKDLVDQIRSFVEKEVQKDYVNLKTSHGIDSQSSSGRLKKWSSTFLK